MSIRRAAFDSTLATVAKLGGALVAIKVIAYSLGPEGMGQVGQFMSVIAILSVLTSGGISVGVTRYVAEGYHRSDPIDALVQTASWMMVICCALLAVTTMIWANTISRSLFGSEEYSFTLRVGCLFLLPIGYSVLGFAVVNGLSATSALVCNSNRLSYHWCRGFGGSNSFVAKARSSDWAVVDECLSRCFYFTVVVEVKSAKFQHVFPSPRQ